MRLVLSCLRTLFFSLVAAIAGGFAAGAALMTVHFALGLPSLSSAGGLVATLVAFLQVALVAGLGGAFFGLWLGLLPTLVLGACLSALKNRWLFAHGGTWAAVGAAAGVTMQYVCLLTLGMPVGWDWGAAWVIGGAASAWTYWGLDTGLFAKRRWGWMF